MINNLPGEYEIGNGWISTCFLKDCDDFVLNISKMIFLYEHKSKPSIAISGHAIKSKSMIGYEIKLDEKIDSDYFCNAFRFRTDKEFKLKNNI